jgi:nucleoside-diphosphate-sugar epimerase
VDIRGKKFLVIGGAGLIGSHCVDELVKEDNVRRFHKTRRVEGGQKILFMLAWDGVQTRRVLEKFAARIVYVPLDLLSEANKLVFDNQRQVCKVRFRGGALG